MGQRLHNIYFLSGERKSFRKPHANLPDTLIALSSASKYFQMLPGPTRALHSALRLCKGSLRCTRQHLRLWRCTQDAMRFDYKDSQILKPQRPLHRYVRDFGSSWDLCAGQQETLRAAETSAQALWMTYYHGITAVILRVPQPEAISYIMFIFVTVRRFPTSWYGMYCLSLSLDIHTEIQGLWRWTQPQGVYIWQTPG